MIEDNGIAFVNGDGVEMARIEETMKDGLVEVKLSGSFTSELRDDLNDEIVALISVGQGIELNLKEARHLSPSVGLAFLSLEEKLEARGKLLRLTHVPPVIYQLFKDRGMQDIFKMELEQ